MTTQDRLLLSHHPSAREIDALPEEGKVPVGVDRSHLQHGARGARHRRLRLRDCGRARRRHQRLHHARLEGRADAHPTLVGRLGAVSRVRGGERKKTVVSRVCS